MTVNGKVALVRYSQADETETTISDKIEFEGGINPDGRSHIVSFSATMGRTQTDNPAPFQEIARKPDTGFSGLQLHLRLFFDEHDGNAALGITRLRNWYRLDNTVKDIFREGRIGLRNDYRPEFNLVPNKDAGYKLSSFEINQDMLHYYMIDANLTLEFSGNAYRLGV